MTNELWNEKLDMLPADTRGRIRRYIEDGRGASMSTFYRCVLSNDLTGAVQGSDAENLVALPAYVDFLTAYAPKGCFGSVENVHAWRGINNGGC